MVKEILARIRYIEPAYSLRAYYISRDILYADRAVRGAR